MALRDWGWTLRYRLGELVENPLGPGWPKLRKPEKVVHLCQLPFTGATQGACGANSAKTNALLIAEVANVAK